MNVNKTMKSNFSLIELLVVIGVISILASLLLPALNKAKDKAKEIQCASNMKNIGHTVYSYLDDYGGYFPVADRNQNYTSNFPRAWYHMLWPYTGSAQYDIFNCPSKPEWTLRVPDGQTVPGWCDSTGKNGGYGWNSDYLGYHLDVGGIYAPDRCHQKLSRVKNPSNTCVIADKRTESYYIESITRHGGANIPDIRHNKRANVLFVDGHVKGHGYSDFTDDLFNYE